jgi:hypothetical protein
MVPYTFSMPEPSLEIPRDLVVHYLNECIQLMAMIHLDEELDLPIQKSLSAQGV